MIEYRFDVDLHLSLFSSLCSVKDVFKCLCIPIFELSVSALSGERTGMKGKELTAELQSRVGDIAEAKS